MRRRTAACFAVSCAVAVIAPAMAQPSGDVRRLRGIIDKDEAWSGTILITDNLTIDGATIRVLPGTLIEFAGGDPTRYPVLTVGAEVQKGGVPDAVVKPSGDQPDALLRPAGRLELSGTADKPIVVRTAAGSGAGRIVVVVRNRIASTRLEQGKVIEQSATSQSADQLSWRHVRFERLGYTQPQKSSQRDVDVSQPAVLFLIRQGGQSVTVNECAFRTCTQMLVHTAADCDVQIGGCRFEETAEMVSLRCRAVAAADLARSLRIADNFASAMFVISAGPAQLTGNRLIGPRAAIAVRSDAIGDVTLESNYVHCTDESDTGRYVLNVERPDAVVKDNVLIGGTYVVHQGSRRMNGNVLIAAPRLAGGGGGKARTHRLVASLPSGSNFEGNVLVGPALALIGPQQSLSPSRNSADLSNATRVANNVFDGGDGITKAVQINLPRAAGGAIECFNNLAVRCGPLVADSTSEADALTYCDFNAVIGGPERLFQRASVADRRIGEDGWSRHDIRQPSLDQIGLPALPDAVPNLDADVISGSMSVPEARRRLIEPYQPHSGGPLAEAGRPMGAPPRPGVIGLAAQAK